MHAHANVDNFFRCCLSATQMQSELHAEIINNALADILEI